MKNDLFFRLYGNCKIVDGAFQSTICDLFRFRYKVIPKLLSEVLVILKTNSIEETKRHFNNEISEGIDAYLDQLIKDDWGLLTKTPDFFPEMSEDYYYPGKISNAILDFDKESKYDFDKCLSDLDEIRCEYLQVRVFDKDLKFDDLLNKVKSVNGKSFRFCEFYIWENAEISKDNIEKHIHDFRSIQKIVCFGSGRQKRETIYLNQMVALEIDFIVQSDFSEESCGKVDKNLFVVDIPMYTEALQFNSCLNNKVSVDRNGHIKHCPSMKRSFGNISDVNISDVIDLQDFLQVWNINKDKIEVCKDCEYRYICQDCRAYISNEDDIFSKPIKCNYDPYVGKWQY